MRVSIEVVWLRGLGLGSSGVEVVAQVELGMGASIRDTFDSESVGVVEAPAPVASDVFEISSCLSYDVS